MSSRVPHQTIGSNPLVTKKDLQHALLQLTDPLRDFYSEGRARLQLSGAGAGHSDEVAGLEGFSRVLWGLVPMLAGGADNEKLWSICMEGIIHGTTPTHPEYWGDVADYDQRLVEMAALGLALCLIPERIWEPLGEQEQRHLYKWLNQINEHPCHDCNWLFFQVMVNLGFRQIGQPYDSMQMEHNLLRMEEFYLDNGWYSDGIGGHSDYYIPFAMHYYALIYAKLMNKEDPERCDRFKGRALQFADQFLHWFAADGSALPYGRSLTYRFAQSAFWSAFAFAGLGTDRWTPGVIKGMLLRNLRWWFKQPILDATGLLTVGYAYPNLIMAENYNAPGSPYWALKAFLVLALPDDDAFWREPEQEMPEMASISVQADPHLVLCRDESGHVAAFNSGHLATNGHTHTSAKYEKFVYSTQFGFSVPRAEWGLGQSAADSMLALSEKDDYLYRVRRRNEQAWIKDNVLHAVWRPWQDVEVRTWIIAGLPWHIRIHRVDTRRSLDAAEGGFSLGLGPEHVERKSPEQAVALGTYGASAVRSLQGYERCDIIRADANTNVLFPRTVLPMLHVSLEPGTHWLASAIYGGTGNPGMDLTDVLEKWSPESLKVTFDRETIGIATCAGEEICIDIRGRS